MGLFHKDPWKDGVRTTATVERVWLTGHTQVNVSNQSRHPEVILTFQFTDEHGAVVTQEGKFAVAEIPPPGSIADIAYLPEQLGRIEFDQRTWRPPDPNVPRGWSAGIFEVEDLAAHRSRDSDDRRAIDVQRELFRTGRRAQAKVVNYKHGGWRVGKANEGEMVFTLAVNGDTIEARACVSYGPEPGDVIEIALDLRGSLVALDSDERYYGPTSQGLVFNTPEVAFARTPEGMIAQRQAAADGMQSKLAAQVTRLEDLRERGVITEEMFESMKAKLLGG